MTDKLVMCNRCTSDACYEMVGEAYTSYMCMGCGFHANTFRTKENVNYEDVEERIPELHKALRYIDEGGMLW